MIYIIKKLNELLKAFGGKSRMYGPKIIRKNEEIISDLSQTMIIGLEDIMQKSNIPKSIKEYLEDLKYLIKMKTDKLIN